MLFPIAVELLAEVVQSSSLSEAEIEQQRSVVLRELEEVEGSLQDVCLDLLHATAFQGTPLGHSVLGPSVNARYAHSFQDARYCISCFKCLTFVSFRLKDVM